ncbi:MAG: hypothetical protein JST84_18715 [Acidobacteria bacterium]|nr:hypothetical protein [Acidobacteriota bacterium]
MNSKMAGLRKALTVTVMVTVGSLNSLVLNSALAQVSSKLAGDISVRGTVTLNGMNTASGATVFDGSLIKTGSNGAATVNLGHLGQIELGADSELVLKLENGLIGGNLRTGHAVVSAPMGTGVNVLTADGIATTEGRDATVLTVDAVCGNTRVAAAKSDARLVAGSRVEIVAAGQEVEVGAQQAPNCKRMAVAAPSAGIGAGALAALLIAGISGAIIGVIATTQGDDITPSQVNVSGFRP